MYGVYKGFSGVFRGFGFGVQGFQSCSYSHPRLAMVVSLVFLVAFLLRKASV